MVVSAFLTKMRKILLQESSLNVFTAIVLIRNESSLRHGTSGIAADSVFGYWIASIVVEDWLTISGRWKMLQIIKTGFSMIYMMIRMINSSWCLKKRPATLISRGHERFYIDCRKSSGSFQLALLPMNWNMKISPCSVLLMSWDIDRKTGLTIRR